MGKRIDREKATVGIMIRMYCHGHRHTPHGGLCRECRELLDYATVRLSACPHGECKPTCRRCAIHCYNKEMKRRIAAVMRWSGKRMMLYHPIAALRHLMG